MHIICLTPISDGVYNDNKSDNIIAPPDGWAMIPEDLPLPSTFPRLGSIKAQLVGGVMTVSYMTEGTLPDDPAIPPTQQREAAYNTAKIIPWEGGNITVTEAAQLWQYYAAEGSMKAYDLQALIAKAKSEIRARYPDVEVAK